ncbi:response regulator [Rhizobiales bacterium]|uniref:response regulator n=1 Tax=Hongsoonwoonella zoysiae TaxID=2821844 RepID=UPI001561713D|nr:response regulator [Hongsoonwoonella zoysiae]
MIAIVDDDDPVRGTLQRMVLSLSFDPVDFRSGHEFVASLDRRAPDCMLLDLHMPGFNGPDLFRELASRRRGIPAIAVTGLDQPAGLARKML